MPRPPTSPPHPLSLPAQPERTGGRAIGVLLVHGFTGSPASMKPWARAPRRAGVRRRGAAAARPRHHLAGPQHRSPGPTGTARLSAAFDAAARETATPWSSAGCRWAAALVLRLAEERGDQVAGVVLVNPFVVEQAQGASSCCPCSSTSCRRSAAIVNDIKKPDQDEHGYPRTPPQGRPLDDVVVEGGGRRTWAGSPSRCSTSARPRTTSSTSSSEPTIQRRARLDRRRGADRSTNSYHVATLDNDAERDLRGVRGFRRAGDRLTCEPWWPVSMRGDRTGRTTTAWQQIVDNYGERPDVPRPTELATPLDPSPTRGPRALPPRAVRRGVRPAAAAAAAGDLARTPARLGRPGRRRRSCWS